MKNPTGSSTIRILLCERRLTKYGLMMLMLMIMTRVYFKNVTFECLVTNFRFYYPIILAAFIF